MGSSRRRSPVNEAGSGGRGRTEAGPASFGPGTRMYRPSSCTQSIWRPYTEIIGVILLQAVPATADDTNVKQMSRTSQIFTSMRVCRESMAASAVKLSRMAAKSVEELAQLYDWKLPINMKMEGMSSSSSYTTAKAHFKD